MKKEFFKIILIFSAIVATVIFGLDYLYGGNAKNSKASGETMNLSFSPATKTIPANEDFAVTLMAKPSLNTVLRGYKTRVTFDKSKLKFKSIEYKLGVVSAGIGNTTAHAATINARGSLDVVGEITTAAGNTLTAANGAEIAIINFTALTATGNSVLTDESSFFSINANKSLFAGWTFNQGNLSINGGGPTLTPTNGVSGNAKLKLQLKFQGIAKKPPTAVLNKMTVRFKLYDETTETATNYRSADFTANDNGIWSGEVVFDVLANRRYALYIKSQFGIQKKVCDEAPTETAGGTYKCSKGNISLTTGDNSLNLSGITLLSGDLPDQDGSVTAYDTSLVRNNLGKTDADSVAKSDINRDGKVDTQDYSLIIGSLSIKNDEL